MIPVPELGDHVILAIDTSLGTSVALGVGAQAFEATSDDPRGHSEAIGGLIAEVFELSGVQPQQVTHVVAGTGPGPFTGLRVGIAAAHAFALGRGMPVLSLHSPDAVALNVLDTRSGKVRVVQDARRRELFMTDYEGLDERGLPVSIDAEGNALAMSAPRLVTRADYEPVLHEVWPERIPATALVRLAARRLELGAPFASPEALYLRVPDVALPKPPKRVST